MGAGVFAVVSVWLIALSIYDIRDRRLPNFLTLPGAGAVLGLAALTGHGPPALLGGLALAGAYFVVHLLSPAAMGAGDVKLAIGVGAFTGAFGVEVWTLAALAAPLLTAIMGIGTLLRDADSAVPHGPSMCVATAGAVALAYI